MDSDVMCCETKTGLDGWSEVCGCLVSTNYKEPPLVIIEDEWTQVNSNGGHVIPTISAVEYKGVKKQKDTGGGISYVIARERAYSFNFELYDKGYEFCGCISAKRAHDWIVY